MTPRWRHCLHRVNIDTLRAKRLARKILKSDVLEDVEHTLTDGDQTESCAGKKNRADERLITQWCESGGLEVTDFSHQFVERLPFTSLSRPTTEIAVNR
jgi:hypothetical protein